MFCSGYQHHPTSFANLALGNTHEIINDLHRRAARLAPRFYEDTADAGCTNLRPTSGRRQQVWDMLAEALAWNHIADYPELVDAALAFDGEVTVSSDFGVYTVTLADGTVIEHVERDAQVRRAYDEAGIAWATSGGKVWPAGSEYDAECEPCVKGFAHIHPAPQAPEAPVLNEAEKLALEAGDGTFRCPECDTYSGHFDLTQPGEIVHSICGRAGSPASFIRGTTAYDAAAEGDYNGWGDGDADEGGLFGDGVSYDQPEGYGIDEEADAAQTFAAALSTQAWVDLAPHLSCREADAAVAFLQALDHEAKAQALLEAHAASDEEGDAHWQA